MTHDRGTRRTFVTTSRYAALVLLVSALCGCAATPLPADRLALAATAIERAEREGAVAVAPAEMQAARDKLARAERSPTTRPGAADAGRLAEQAEADARLAEARARAARTTAAAAEVDRSLDALREEVQRAAEPPSP